MVIYKYPVSFLPGRQKIKLPEGAKILSVQVKDEEPWLWALVNSAAPMLETEIVCHLTGAHAPSEKFGQHIDTVQHRGFVFHYFLS